MPHKKFGTVGFLLGGGGCLEGLPQAVQINVFLRSGIIPDHILAESVGAFNALNPKRAQDLWKNHINTPEKIYQPNPTVKQFAEQLVDAIPHKPKFPPEEPRDWKEFVADAKIQFYKAMHILHVMWQLLDVPFPEKNQYASSAFQPLLASLVERAKRNGLYDLENLLELAPLLTILTERMDVKNILNEPWSLHILTRVLETADECIFSTGSPTHPLTAENVIEVARASAALRPLFPPVEINGARYCDGGQIDPLPVEYLFDQRCDTVFAFVKNHLKFAPQDNILTTLIFEEIAASEKAMFARLLKHAQHRTRKEGKSLFLIHPTEPIHPDLDLLAVSPAAIEYTLRVETKSTIEFLSKIQ